MKGDDLSDRLLDFAVRVIRLIHALPKTAVAFLYGWAGGCSAGQANLVADALPPKAPRRPHVPDGIAPSGRP